MTRSLARKRAIGPSGIRRNPTVSAFCLAFLLSSAGSARSAEDSQPKTPQRDAAVKACKVLADRRLEGPLSTIADEYRRRTGAEIELEFLPAAEVDAAVNSGRAECDVVLAMPAGVKSETAVGSMAGAKKVAWKYPSGEPVWAAAITDHAEAANFIRFAGGPTGHRLWSESVAGFTITSGGNHAEAYAWVVENRLKHTYPMTAARMMAELGGIRKGTCIDIGCGTGHLDVELARRSQFKIIGLDIDADMKPLFEKKIGDAGLRDRVSFVAGDAQKLPFPDDYADAIVSRGTLVFIPDVARCLREVDRVLKPTGVAFLGGRYVYTPQKHKIATEKLRQIVRDSGVAGARVIDARGQWVEIRKGIKDRGLRG